MHVSLVNSCAKSSSLGCLQPLPLDEPLSLERGSKQHESTLLRALATDVDMMKSCRSQHPATMQAVQMLALYQWKPVPPQLHEGYRSARYQYAEPATTMQHLLHSMYLDLMVKLTALLQCCCCIFLTLQ